MTIYFMTMFCFTVLLTICMVMEFFKAAAKIYDEQGYSGGVPYTSLPQKIRKVGMARIFLEIRRTKPKLTFIFYLWCAVALAAQSLRMLSY